MSHTYWTNLFWRYPLYLRCGQLAEYHMNMTCSHELPVISWYCRHRLLWLLRQVLYNRKCVLFIFGENRACIGCRLQRAVRVRLCLAAYNTLNWARLIYKYRAGCGFQDNVGRSQSAWYWAMWFIDLNVLGDMAASLKSWGEGNSTSPFLTKILSYNVVCKKDCYTQHKIIYKKC